MTEFEKISIETREALKSLHKLFPANPSPEDSPWGFLEGLRLEILDLQVQIKSFEEDLKLQGIKYQEILKEIGKIGLEDEKEKQELRCKIQAQDLAIQLQEAREGDGWKEQARKHYLFGDCPTCFRPRGEGHEEHCHFGQFFRNNQELIEEVVSLREKINKLNQEAKEGDGWQAKAKEAFLSGSCPTCFRLKEQGHQGNCQWAEIGRKNQDLAKQLAESRAKIEKLKQEAGEGDGWQAKAKEYFENGGCPVCFASDEEGHKKGCEWGDGDKEYQKIIDEEKKELIQVRKLNENLRALARNRSNFAEEALEQFQQIVLRFNGQTKAIEDLTKSLSDSQDKQQHLERKCRELQKGNPVPLREQVSQHLKAREARLKSSQSEYMVVKGDGRGFESQCSTAMANGWRLQGGIAVKSNGELNQAFVR